MIDLSNLAASFIQVCQLRRRWKALASKVEVTTIFNHRGEKLLCKPCVVLRIMTSGGEDFHPGSETRLDYLELFV